MNGVILSTGQRNHDVNLFADENMKPCLKGLSLSPCNVNSPSNLNQIPRNQVCKVPKVRILNSAEYCQMKRKLEQYINDGKSATTFGLNSEKSSNEIGKKLKKGESSSILCQPKSINNINDSLKGKQANIALKEKPNIGSSKQVLKLCIKKDIENLSGTNDSRNLKNEDKQLKETINLVPFCSKVGHLSRPVIPIGPKFQADVPRWEGSIKKRHQEDDDDDSKWLGTQIWPMKGVTLKTNAKVVGKGRSCLCKCDFVGSVNCVKQHINEERLRLKYDIGSTFWILKFNEMGENVSKSWTWEEEDKFKSLVKWNPLSSKTNFWKLACESFPSRSMKSLVSYYYNVYIPRRMSLDTRSFFGEVESDDD